MRVDLSLFRSRVTTETPVSSGGSPSTPCSRPTRSRSRGLIDPWGNPYLYLNIENATGKIEPRKDKNLKPISSDYDLYSMGPDGRTKIPLTAKDSRDDTIRAADGAYVGIAEDY